MNYCGSYIQALGSDAERDIWRDGRWQMDVNGSVNIVKGLTFWVEAVNVLNSEQFSYLETRVEFIICSIAVLTDVVALPINSN